MYKPLKVVARRSTITPAGENEWEDLGRITMKFERNSVRLSDHLIRFDQIRDAKLKFQIVNASFVQELSFTTSEAQYQMFITEKVELGHKFPFEVERIKAEAFVDDLAIQVISPRVLIGSILMLLICASLYFAALWLFYRA